jgi:diacylglycerol kinase family enzyme
MQKPFRLKSVLKISNIGIFFQSHPNFDKIILLGGDGTIHHLSNQLATLTNPPSIHIKKNGSGNDLLRSLKRQKPKKQSLMICQTEESQSHYFINGTGLGIDGLVIYHVNQKRKKGHLAYFKATLKALFQYIPEPLSITIDGTTHNFTKAYSVIINNGMYVGGGMKMTPNAKLEDELLDVIVIHSVSKIKLLFLFLSVYFGLHLKFKRYIFHQRAKSVSATFTTPQYGQSDGELMTEILSLNAHYSGKDMHYKPMQ